MTSRLKAFLIHLAISLLIALVIIGLVFFIWYPTPLHNAVGVTEIFLILLGVDVVLGSLLTLLVYKPGKKNLVMDLTVIACLQLAALSYGLWTVAEGRPAWLVFAVDRFELVRVLDIDERKLDEAPAEYQAVSWFGPQWVAASAPADNEERNAVMMESMFGGFDIASRPHLYAPLSTQKAAIQQRLQELSALPDKNSRVHIQNILTANPQADSWLPLTATNQDMVVLMKRSTAEVIAIVDLRPW